MIILRIDDIYYEGGWLFDSHVGGSIFLHEKEVLVAFIIQRRYVEPLLWGLVFSYIVFSFIGFQMR